MVELAGEMVRWSSAAALSESVPGVALLENTAQARVAPMSPPTMMPRATANLVNNERRRPLDTLDQLQLGVPTPGEVASQRCPTVQVDVEALFDAWVACTVRITWALDPR